MKWLKQYYEKQLRPQIEAETRIKTEAELRSKLVAEITRKILVDSSALIDGFFSFTRITSWTARSWCLRLFCERFNR